MESHLDCNICITNHRTHNRVSGEIKEHKAYINRDIDIQHAVWGGSSFCNATIMYRADFMKEHLDLDEWIKRRLSLQDWPAWVILTAYTDIEIIQESTATFGIETVSITRPDTYERLEARMRKDKEVCRYLGELFPDKFPFSDDMCSDYQNHQLMCMAFRKLDYSAAKKYGKEATKSKKQRISQNWLLFQGYSLLRMIRRWVS